MLSNQAFMLSPEPGIVPDQPTLLCEMLDRLLENVSEAEKALCALCQECVSGEGSEAQAEQIQRAENNLVMATCDFGDAGMDGPGVELRPGGVDGSCLPGGCRAATVAVLLDLRAPCKAR